jgi:hypothetical protein
MAPAGPELAKGQLGRSLRETWFNVSFGVAGFAMTAAVDGEVLFEGVVDTKAQFASGWAGLSCGWQTCQFDDFVIIQSAMIKVIKLRKC